LGYKGSCARLLELEGQGDEVSDEGAEMMEGVKTDLKFCIPTYEESVQYQKCLKRCEADDADELRSRSLEMLRSSSSPATATTFLSPARSCGIRPTS
jgi:hypothetical protein